MRFQRRPSVMIAALLAALVSVPSAQTPARGSGAASAQTPALLQIRQAIGHGDAARARQIAGGADEAIREIGLALVEIFEGKDDSAEQRLTGPATRSPGGEAAL